MPFEAIFDSPAQRAEKHEMPVVRALIERYAQTQPFQGLSVVFGHLLVRNSLPVAEALWRGGAQITLADTRFSPATVPVREELEEHGVPIVPVAQAVQRGDWFLDVGAVLGRARTPLGAAEVTRTGVLHYQKIPCPVMSADDCRAKHIEGFFGTGDGFVRAWKKFKPQEPLRDKRVMQFGFGKIGRGVATHLRDRVAAIHVVEVDDAAQQRAQRDGFPTLLGEPHAALEEALAEADIVIAVTGVPGAIGRVLPPSWLRANHPALVNLGAEDEFGVPFSDEEILGGRELPFNHHLPRPTRNRYVDPPLAAHLLALEALVSAPTPYPVGVHPLPVPMDTWILDTWRAAFPEEDLAPLERDW